MKERVDCMVCGSKIKDRGRLGANNKKFCSWSCYLVFKDNAKLPKEHRRKWLSEYMRNPEVRKRVNENGKLFEKRCIESWEGYIPVISNCEVCGKEIKFNRKVLNESIHFDHKDDSEKKIKNKSPNQWLRKNKRTPENEAIWDSCGWGRLCRRCNSSLPTRNRKEFVINVVKYVFGKDYHATAQYFGLGRHPHSV